MFGITYDESIGQLIRGEHIVNQSNASLDETLASIMPGIDTEIPFIHETNNFLDQTIIDVLEPEKKRKNSSVVGVSLENPKRGIVLDQKIEKSVVCNLNKLLEQYGMKLNEDVRHYYVNLTCTVGSIYTIEAGWHNKEVLVLVHGFGASSVYYYRMLPALAKKYHVYAFDLYGLGLSTRPKFEHTDKHIILQKLIQTIEDWRLIMKINKFDLIAHSFGAFLCCHYIDQYKPNVGRVFLCSPAGFTRLEKGQFDNIYKNLNMIEKHLYHTCMQEKKICVFEAIPPWMKKIYIDNWLNNPILKLCPMEKLYLKKLFHVIITLKTSYETAACYLLEYGSYSSLPISSVIKSVRDHCKVHIYYGDIDWMDYKSACKYLGDKKIDIEVEMIANSGHVFMLENPFGLLEKIFTAYLSKESRTQPKPVVYDNILTCLDLNDSNIFSPDDPKEKKKQYESRRRKNQNTDKSISKSPFQQRNKEADLSVNESAKKVDTKYQRAKTVKVQKQAIPADSIKKITSVNVPPLNISDLDGKNASPLKTTTKVQRSNTSEINTTPKNSSVLTTERVSKTPKKKWFEKDLTNSFNKFMNKSPGNSRSATPKKKWFERDLNEYFEENVSKSPAKNVIITQNKSITLDKSPNKNVQTFGKLPELNEPTSPRKSINVSKSPKKKLIISPQILTSIVGKSPVKKGNSTSEKNVKNSAGKNGIILPSKSNIDRNRTKSLIKPQRLKTAEKAKPIIANKSKENSFNKPKVIIKEKENVDLL